MYPRLSSQPENPFASLVADQHILEIPEFCLESGEVLVRVPVAYKTWGTLNAAANNALVICHALTGSSDASDWWGPLLGPGKAFDYQRFFIVCINALGSPYGSASPCTINPATGRRYGPEFPLTSVKDDVRLQRLVLDDLEVRQVAAVVGGSMGGMLVLEYAYFGRDYVRTIVPLATCACHSAWAISWGEAQRQAIYSDPNYDDGYYELSNAPVVGLGAARMQALLTYRSRDSFEIKFGRRLPDPLKHRIVDDNLRLPETPSEQHWAVHNHGHRNGRRLKEKDTEKESDKNKDADADKTISRSSSSSSIQPQTHFTAQNYLRYQARKFVQRFDANCYIAITRKLDTHDLARGRAKDIIEALAMIEQPTLVIGVSSDGLFTFPEQERLAQHIPNSELARIESPDGHDAFLLEFEDINRLISRFFHTQLEDIVGGPTQEVPWEAPVVKPSVFGEVEAEEDKVVEERTMKDGSVLDVTNW